MKANINGLNENETQIITKQIKMKNNIILIYFIIMEIDMMRENSYKVQ